MIIFDVLKAPKMTEKTLSLKEETSTDYLVLTHKMRGYEGTKPLNFVLLPDPHSYISNSLCQGLTNSILCVAPHLTQYIDICYQCVIICDDK